MTLHDFLFTPNACIICNTVEDFEFLQKIFTQKNIKWRNGASFSNTSQHLKSRGDLYPIYITSNCTWGLVSDEMNFSKMTTILDMEAIDDFYDERITIEEFINLPYKCAIHVSKENQALKLLDRLDMLGKVTDSGKPYTDYIDNHNIQPYNDETCWSNKGTFGKSHNYDLCYKFDDINFNITLSDFLDRNKGNKLRVIHCTTKEQAQLVYDAISKMKSYSYMNGCPIQPDIYYTNRGTYSAMESCYINMKESDGDYNITFAPIYEFEEVDLSR